MGTLYETSKWGMWLKVHEDRVEFKRKPGWNPIESVPLTQVASIKVGSAWKNTITIETTGGKEYEIPTSDKKAAADAIYAAQAGRRPTAPAPSTAGVADEIGKLAGLRDRGVLSDEEFQRQKTALLGGARRQPAPIERALAPEPTPTSPSSIVRKLKIAGLATAVLLVALIALGMAAGPERNEANDTPAPPTAALARPMDDADRVIEACGRPDEDDSTVYDDPRPPIPSRMLVYRRARLMFAYLPGAGTKIGDPPPYRWKLLGVTDTKTKKAVSGNLRRVLEKRLPCALSAALADEP